MDQRSFLRGARAGASVLSENRRGSRSAALIWSSERERERLSFPMERYPPLQNRQHRKRGIIVSSCESGISSSAEAPLTIVLPGRARVASLTEYGIHSNETSFTSFSSDTFYAPELVICITSKRQIFQRHFHICVVIGSSKLRSSKNSCL